MLSPPSLDRPSVPYWYAFSGIWTNVRIAASSARGKSPMSCGSNFAAFLEKHWCVLLPSDWLYNSLITLQHQDLPQNLGKIVVFQEHRRLLRSLHSVILQHSVPVFQQQQQSRNMNLCRPPVIHPCIFSFNTNDSLRRFRVQDLDNFVRSLLFRPSRPT